MHNRKLFKQNIKNTKHIKGQIHGQHIPAMLRHAREQEINRNKIKIKYHPSPDIPVNNVTWQALLLLLIICPAVIAETRVLDFMTIHHQPVSNLPETANCKRNKDGISGGMICDIADQTYYLKQIRLPTYPGKQQEKEPFLVLEEYNRQFVKNNIGIKTPKTRFFKRTLPDNEKQFYIGGEKIEGLNFAAFRKATDRQLGPKGIARLAVAMTFIQDLHELNFGFDGEGLALIDVDSFNKNPETIHERLRNAGNNIFALSPPLSIKHIRHMLEIYVEMEEKRLPLFHDEFLMTTEKYHELLDLYKEACSLTLKRIRQLHPDISDNEATEEINQAWCESINKLLPENKRLTCAGYQYT